MTTEEDDYEINDYEDFEDDEVNYLDNEQENNIKNLEVLSYEEVRDKIKTIKKYYYFFYCAFNYYMY